ncbi:EI24 domain-containing protein [Spiractinospora alimapuensis]|uniref:EI24 domain-containing protein n=1 Tax=Spiractinospora alimapuensis TaxID=2820884 RepID=UPI001F248B86|nr:EI24 domain-containing protein [Spiractinospora alimapuensis]QVQ51643.1 EI24 domain-containing protein [Spiractinospora alimapuensis]
MLRDFFSGVGALLRGATTILSRPRLFGLGLIPPLVTTVLYIAALVALAMNITNLVEALTPFADGWTAGWQNTVRIAAGVALFGGLVVLMVVAFTTITLALGSPIYDKIGEMVEEHEGTAPAEVEEPTTTAIARGIRQSLAIVLMGLVVTICVFAVGFVPLVGQVVATVASAVLGGWILALEMTGGAMERRGLLPLRARNRILRANKARVLGFSVPTFLLLAIPFVAVAVFPAASAGGTILARSITPDPTPAPGGTP